MHEKITLTFKSHLQYKLFKIRKPSHFTPFMYYSTKRTTMTNT